MDRPYVGDVGTIIEVDCGENITTATGITLEIRKPNGSKVSKAASLYSTTKLRYTVISGDLDQSGKYSIQPKLTISGWIGRGETVTMDVYSQFD